MAIDIKVPQLPESVADATIATWHVKPGDKVSRDQNLVDIETDKVVLEVVAEADGVIGEIIADEGTTVTAEEVIGKIEEGAGDDSNDDSDSKDSAKEDKKEESSSKDDNASEKSGSGEKIEVKVPQLPESVSDATIATWRR